MELWDIYDENRVKTGRLHKRGDDMAQGDYHMVIHVCLMNSQGQMLLQQRRADKKGWPGLWDFTVAGSALAGETSQQAVARELKEELGISFDFTGIRPSFTVNFSQGFDDFYIIHREVDTTSVTLQQSEVQDVKWASYDEIKKMMDSNCFIPYHQPLTDMIFAMKDSYGCHSSERPYK